MKLTDQAHSQILEHFKQRPESLGLAVDATCGQGFDTLFLAQLGFDVVIGFDVQPEAIKATHQRCAALQNSTIKLLNVGHQHLYQHIEQAIDCIMFNLGYLPKHDQSITTQAATSVAAMRSAIRSLSSNGIMTILCYPGHPSGKVETAEVKQWLQTLAPKWRIDSYRSVSITPTSPVLYIIRAQQTG